MLLILSSGRLCDKFSKPSKKLSICLLRSKSGSSIRLSILRSNTFDLQRCSAPLTVRAIYRRPQPDSPRAQYVHALSQVHLEPYGEDDHRGSCCCKIGECSNVFVNLYEHASGVAANQRPARRGCSALGACGPTSIQDLISGFSSMGGGAQSVADAHDSYIPICS